MNKTTIELHRIKDTTSFVGHWGIPFSQESGPTLDTIVEWAQRAENVGQKIYRHVIRAEEENVREEPHNWPGSNAPEFVYPRKCDYVTYLDIYHQDK